MDCQLPTRAFLAVHQLTMHLVVFEIDVYQFVLVATSTPVPEALVDFEASEDSRRNCDSNGNHYSRNDWSMLSLSVATLEGVSRPRPFSEKISVVSDTRVSLVVKANGSYVNGSCW